ncbi:MAG: FAD-binding oxidoreductase [Nanoarchaeota archaeon]|nr:FAD-binding oxidoreductase [Nanoarchaeota archaeon]
MSESNLKAELEKIVGYENVFTVLSERLPYRYGNLIEYRIDPPEFLPDFITKPSSAKQISEILKLANMNRIPVVAWGGGTDFSGANSPIKGGIVIDMKSINNIDINREEQYARTGAGAILLEITKEAEKNGFLFPHEITTQPSATIGGAIATNSFGHRSGPYRSIRSLILGLEFVLPTGEIVRTKPLFRTSMGYDLISLLVGSEGTLAIITEATMKLIPEPESRGVSFHLFNSFEDGFKAAKEILSNGTPEFFDLVELSFLKYTDSGIEFLKKYMGSKFLSHYLHSKYIDESVYGTVFGNILSKAPPTKNLIKYLENTINKKGCLVILTVGFEGDKESVKSRTKIVSKIAKSNGGLKFEDKAFYEKRFTSYHEVFQDILPHLPLSENYGGMSIDVSIPSTKVNEIKDKIHELVQKYKEIQLLDIDLYSSLSTLGIDLAVSLSKSKIHKKFFHELKNSVLSADGSLSFAHGVGTRLLPHIEDELTREHIQAMIKIKKAIDPNNILNPGKIGDNLEIVR